MKSQRWLETRRKIEEVNEAARTGRLDDINSHLEGLDRYTFITILCGTLYTDTNAFTIAIKEGQTEVVRLLVEKYKVTVNETAFCKVVPLLCTGKDCPLEITKILVENGADVNQIGKYTKATALTRACQFNRLDVVQYLVEKGAKINQRVGGGTALSIACGDKCLDAVRCLVECGADVNLAVGKSQRTPLHVACQAKSLDIARHLVEHGANINATDSEGCSPLGICCKNGSTGVMRFLLENGADPNLPDRHGRTPLLHAAMNQEMSAVDFCVDMATISRQAKLDGLELLGASLIVHGQIKPGYDYLCRGMGERSRDAFQAVEKVPLSPVPAYGDFRESQTLGELEQRQQDPTLLIKEALLIWERVLGRGTKKVKQTFVRAAIGDNRVPIAWALHAWRSSGSFLLMRDIKELMFVILRRIPFPFSILEEALTLTFQALSNHEDSRWKYDFTSDPSSVYVRGILIFQEAVSVAQTKEEVQRLEGLLRNLLQLTTTGPKGFSALHVALDGKLKTGFRRRQKLSLSPDFIGLLLQCKADPIYAQDEDGNTPLHVLFSRHHDSEELPVAQTVARMLLQAGAHLDARNRKSKTPLDCQYAYQFQEILKDYTCGPPSLQCWCARVILNEKVSFHSLPGIIKKFIKLHGSEMLDNKPFQ